MKKLLALLLALGLVLMCGASLAEDEKVFKLTAAPEGIGDKVGYPWQNMALTESLLWRTMFLADRGRAPA